MKITRKTCSLLEYAKLRLRRSTLAENIALLEQGRQEFTDQFTLMVDANQARVMPSPQPDPVWSYEQTVRKYSQFTWTSEREL